MTTTFKNRPGYGLYETKVRDRETGRVRVERRWMRDRQALNLNATPVREAPAWERTRATIRRIKAWYASVGAAPEPRKATTPVSRSTDERQAVRERYDAWLIANGYDPSTGTDASGFDPWGRHASLTQDADHVRHPLTGKPWAPTGFLRDGVHAKTGTFYDEDGVDARGFMKPDEQGRRIHIATGTVFNLAQPPRTWDGDDEPAHWSKTVEWRTPAVEAEIAATRRQQAEAEARIEEMVRIEKKMERLGLAS